MEPLNSRIRNMYSISQKKFKEMHGIPEDERIVEVKNTSYFGGMGSAQYDVEVITEKSNNSS